MTAETGTADNLGVPTAAWLRSRGYSAKQTARVVGACEGIGKQLRAGRAPTAEQMAKLSQHFGWTFVRHVFEAVIGPSDAELARDLHDIKARLERLESVNASPDQARPSVLPMAGSDLDCPS